MSLMHQRFAGAFRYVGTGGGLNRNLQHFPQFQSSQRVF
jgi:hypothetical protein